MRQVRRLFERLRPPRPSHQGYVGLLPRGRIKGWIAKPDAPGTRMRVQIRIGDYVSPPITADLPHERLAREGFGDGAYGFRFDLPQAVLLHETDRIHVIDARDGTTLLSTDLSKFKDILPPGHRGYVGLLPRGRVKGWIAKPDALETRMRVQIRVGDYVSPPITADLPHERLAREGFGDGAYGFRFDLPQGVPLRETDRVHVIDARDGTALLSTDLSKFKDILPPGHHGYVALLPRGRVKGWIAKPDALQTRVSIRIRVRDYVSPPLTADLPHERLAREGFGDGAYGFSFYLPPDIALGESDRIEVVDADAGTTLLSADLSKFKDALHTSHEGYVGLLRHRTVKGWIARPDDLSERLQVRVRVRDYLSPPLTADLPHERLMREGFGDGAYGFRFDLPATLLLRETDRIEIVDARDCKPLLSTDLSKFKDRLVEAPPTQVRASKQHRKKQSDAALLWCPISVSGLTTQLEQVTQILRQNGVPYKISYHMKPTIDHAEATHWIEPRDIDQPKIVFYFERFVPFDRGFEGAFKVFYVNLDWLRPDMVPLARIHADLILCPVTYKLEEMMRTFPRAKVVHLPWPATFEPETPRISTPHDTTIRVLYIGNDYDDGSRKSPHAVIEAIERYAQKTLRFTLKFRSALPKDVKARIEAHPQVDAVIDTRLDAAAVKALYDKADVNLIPNQCEGNGLSIIEAWARGVVPAVLNGRPMIDVVEDDNAFTLDCERIGMREFVPMYRVSADTILKFFETLTREDVDRRKQAIGGLSGSLKQRAERLEQTILASLAMSGLRGQNERLRIENAHKPESTGAQAHDLLFADQSHRAFANPARHVDILLTASRRPALLRRSLNRLVSAMDASPYQHRLIVAIDGIDDETSAIVDSRRDFVHQVLWTGIRQGLPYMWNSASDLLRNLAARTELRPDYICYIQEDCLIDEPADYFAAMVETADSAHPGILGFVSGYHCALHPGFARGKRNGREIVYSDSIDGKNFMARPSLLASIGPLDWWFEDGTRRGNPGPHRGSHFDLWQWREAPNALTKHTRISVILPGLCRHLAAEASQSTWDNDTSPSRVKERMSAGKVYKTR